MSNATVDALNRFAAQMRGTFEAAGSEIVATMQRLADSMDGAIQTSADALAQRFSEQEGSAVRSIEWCDGGGGNVLFVVTLQNRRKLVGLGPARLEALVAAEWQLGDDRRR